MLNFIVCDDNENILNKITEMLENSFMQFGYDAKVTYTCADPYKILEHVKSNVTHVLILDINLKTGMSGLELAEKVREVNKNIYLIFITSHLEYGLVAYKYKTFDYLPKPITKERFDETLRRLFYDVYATPTNFIKIDNKNTIVAQDSIKYIEKEGMKLIVNTDSSKYTSYTSFNNIEKQLPTSFVRCHKSFIVNIDRVTDVQFKNNVVLFDDTKSQCSIGPKYKNNFMEVLNKYGNITNNLDSFNHTKSKFD